MKKKTKPKHYALRMREEIEDLHNQISIYYDAIYGAKMLVQNRHGLKGNSVYGGSSLIGNEEVMPLRDYESVCKLIESLP